MEPFSVDLFEYASNFLASRGDFTLEELLNYSFALEYRKQMNMREFNGR